MSLRCSVFGLGKLGAPLAAALASRGHSVIGVDVNPELVGALNAGRAPSQETDLQYLVATGRKLLRATTDAVDAIQSSDVTFVVVPTPSDSDGSFSIHFARDAFERIGQALAGKDSYHLVVLTSTVLPGATRHGLLPLLESASAKRCGVDFGLCYNPEFVALGSVIHDILNPDFVLIGEFDRRSGSLLEECYGAITMNGAPCARMSIENAELTKIAVNSFITLKISFANTLAGICERIPGGDVDVVTEALGRDTRIGGKYLKGALPYGGPCFPRDNAALSFFSRTVGAHATLAETTHQTNEAWAEQLARRISSLLVPNMTVAVLGLAYKANSYVVEESAGLGLARAIAGTGSRVIAHDRLATAAAKAELDGTVGFAKSPDECVRQADLVVVTTPDPLYQALKPGDFRPHPPVKVVDLWRCLDPSLETSPNIEYLTVGRSLDDLDNTARLEALWAS